MDDNIWTSGFPELPINIHASSFSELNEGSWWAENWNALKRFCDRVAWRIGSSRPLGGDWLTSCRIMKGL